MSLRNYEELNNSEKDFINKIIEATRSAMSEYAYSERLTPNAYQGACDMAKTVAEYLIPDFNAENLYKNFEDFADRYNDKTLLNEKEVKMTMLLKTELENIPDAISSNEVELNNGEMKVLSLQDKMVFKAILKSALLTVNISAQYSDVTDNQIRITKDLAGDMTRILLPDVEGYKNTYNQLGKVFEIMSERCYIIE